MNRRLACAAAIGTLLGQSAMPGAGVLSGLTAEKDSGISLRVMNFYENLPPRGFLPLRVAIGNDSGAPRTWDIQTAHAMGDTRTSSFSARLEVPAGQEKRFDLLIPLLAQPPDGNQFSNLVVTVRGYGVPAATATEYSSGGGSPPGPYLGMGKSMSVKNWGPLREALANAKKPPLRGTMLDPQFLPADWRGLSGFDAIALDEEEWEKAGSDARRALLDWVAQGGRLALFAAGGPRPGIPQDGPYGAGTITREMSDGDIVEATIKLLDQVTPVSADKLLGGYSWDWAPAASLGRSTPPQGLIILFVLAFAILVGPVNFMVFAPPGRRHRLIWTTPAISLAATFLMAGGIAVAEGFGGRGERILLRYLQPQENRAVLWQEQMSRTGIVVSPQFVPSAVPVLLPLQFRTSGPRNRWGQSAARFALVPQPPPAGTWSGDWFRSRSTQGQAVVVVSPSRERIEFRGDSPPTAISSLPSPVTELWFRDGSGAFWSAPGIAPGATEKLERRDSADFEAWWTGVTGSLGSLTRSRADALREADSSPRFFAIAEQGSAVATLPAIRWTDASTLLVGDATP